jgi:hypothetical protein
MQGGRDQLEDSESAYLLPEPALGCRVRGGKPLQVADW